MKSRRPMSIPPAGTQPTTSSLETSPLRAGLLVTVPPGVSVRSSIDVEGKPDPKHVSTGFRRASKSHHAGCRCVSLRRLPMHSQRNSTTLCIGSRSIRFRYNYVKQHPEKFVTRDGLWFSEAGGVRFLN
jgi:hypothetical protein